MPNDETQSASTASLIDRLASLPPDERAKILASIPDDIAVGLSRDWRFLARTDQIPPATAFLIWLIMGGRGAGKSRTISEWTHDRLLDHYGNEVDGNRTMHRVGAGSRTSADARDVLVEGESGIMAVAERRNIEAKYEPSKRRISWPDLNARLTLFSAEEPDQARGPQYHTVIGDEFAAWDFSITDELGNNLWTNLLLGLRLGQNPQAGLSTTPKRVKALKQLVAQALDPDDATVVLSSASTLANAANLSTVFLDTVISQYEGTRMYQQEVLGILLGDEDEALWSDREITLAHRFLDHLESIPAHARKVVGVDPPTSLTRDECGIVAVSLLATPLPGLRNKCVSVIADRSLKGSPEKWGKRVVDTCIELGITKVVAESNQGGEMVRAVIKNEDKDGSLTVELVHSSVGKRLRAEPVAQLYEQQRVAHLQRFPILEEQMVDWTPEGPDTPGEDDRIDALVHAITYLLPSISQRASSISSAADLNTQKVREVLANAAVAATGLQTGSNPLYRPIRRGHAPSVPTVPVHYRR